jgi:glutamate--cysteine ligase
VGHRTLSAGAAEAPAEDRLDTCEIVDRAAAERYVAKVCFKTGPPTHVGVELEWNVHHRADPGQPLDPLTLIAALGDHAPPTLNPDSPHHALPHGGVLTVEPGGQVEISTPPSTSPAALFTAVSADTARLRELLARSGLMLGDEASDPHRSPRRLLHTPRYAAMEHAYDRHGPHGRVMMCATASLQVCLDAGTPERVTARWQAAHAIGPPLLATFANSPRHAGRRLGWASGRMRTWFGIDPGLRHAPPPEPDPARGWARRAVASPLLCRRRDGTSWNAPPDVTFGDWVDGALHPRPTYGDLEYHLSTLFPLVRPRGYLELRYLDAQPGDDWLVPAALVTALFSSEPTVDAAAAIAAEAADRWLPAARDGLADPVLARVAPELLELAARALPQTDLSPTTIATVTEAVGRHLSRGAHS